jgi:hypothetical protein
MRILIWIAIAVIFFIIGMKYAQNQAGPNPQPLIDTLKSQLQSVNSQLQNTSGMSASQVANLQAQQTSLLSTISSYFGYTVSQVETLLGLH